MELNMYRTALTAVALALSLSLIGLTDRPASAQMMAKAQVANLIAKVENGVDEFRNYLEKRGDNARDASSTAQATGRKKRQATESQKANASSKKDALDDVGEVVARGSYGPEAARLWAVLRTGINDLARAYGVPPMAI
jgi:hypothetical protein